MSQSNSSPIPNHTSVHVLGGEIMCCRKIMITTKKSPSSDPVHHAERMMFFLCSFWAGKRVNQDTNGPTSESFIAANFSGVIKLSVQSATNEFSNATNDRWIAPYHPDHPKSSTLASIGTRGTGPDGQYMEVSEWKAMDEISAGRLIPTDINFKYSNCKIHPDACYLSSWFDFRDDMVNMIPSTELVVSGMLGNVSLGGTLKKCNKCKKKTPSREYRVNIYNSRLTPGHCSDCQWYRRYNEPPRKSRVRVGESDICNRDQSDNNEAGIDNGAIVDNGVEVDNGAIVNNGAGVDNSNMFDNSYMFNNRRTFNDASRIFNGDPTSNNGNHVHTGNSHGDIDPCLLDPRLFDSNYKVQDNNEDLHSAD